jgi:hypothetical protein
VKDRGALGLIFACLAACNYTPTDTTGGADLPARGACPRGFAVVSSDFASSEIALLSPAGSVESAAFMSSASTTASNLAAPLSGDLEVAPSRQRPNELVLIDRQGTNVLTFVDARTATVRAQLPVGGTGFESNPQDYSEIDEHRALVPRLGENNLPGREPFDTGSDLLVIDPSVPVITGSIPLPRRSGFLPNPVAVTRVADDFLVTLQHARADYSGMADSEIVAFSAEDQSLRYRLSLPGLRNCGRVEVAPSGRFLAVACTAYVDRNGAVAEPEASGLVLLDASQTPPVERQRFAALDLIGGPIQSHIELVTDDLLLFKSQTALGADEDNRLFSLDLERGTTRVLASASRAAGASGLGIALRGMRCGVACGDPCFVADASRGELLRFDYGPAGLSPGEPVRIGGAGLPPSGLTPYW